MIEAKYPVQDYYIISIAHRMRETYTRYSHYEDTSLSLAWMNSLNEMGGYMFITAPDDDIISFCKSKWQKLVDAAQGTMSVSVYYQDRRIDHIKYEGAE